MFTTHYVTADDGLLISVQPSGYDDDKDPAFTICGVSVSSCGGKHQIAVPDLQAPHTWPTERIARHALEFAQSIPCDCGSDDCDTQATDVFPGDPHSVRLMGPYLDAEQAMVSALIETGVTIPDALRRQAFPNDDARGER